MGSQAKPGSQDRYRTVAVSGFTGPDNFMQDPQTWHPPKRRSRSQVLQVLTCEGDSEMGHT